MGFVTKVLYFSLVMLALTYGEMLLHAYKHDLLGKLMDETPFWTQDMIASRLDALGENGRQAYRDFYTGLTLKGDMALPIWYSTAMTILLYRGGSGFWMFPIIAGMFDVIENSIVWYAITKYPEALDMKRVKMGGYMATPLKWVFVVASVVFTINAWIQGYRKHHEVANGKKSN